MAKARSFVKLIGSIGDVTFADTPDGMVAKEKTTVDAQRFATDPAFEDQRQHGVEFGLAGKIGALIRRGFRECLKNARDRNMSSRLTGELLRIIKKDPGHDKGQRVVTNGELYNLEGFEFNLNARMAQTLFPEETVTVDRAAGTIKITFESFVPKGAVTGPSQVTHFRLKAMAGEFNFTDLTVFTDSFNSAEIPMDTNATAPIELTLEFTPNSPQPLIIALGVEFLEFINNKYDPKVASVNAFSIIKVAV